MADLRKITPCLWFDGQAEDAAKHYISIFENSTIGRISRYGEEGHEIHGREPGSVMVVEFELEGQKFVGLNGGPQFTFSEAISFQIDCKDQGEVDYFWERLSEGGEEGPCGWLKDKFGLSWQVVPRALPRMLSEGDAEQSARVTKAFIQMKKFDIAELQRAYDGRN
jgi:predicted 3-demethylubiquinone-9 3-methyltransferase (glyoxalase superfamily)